MTTLERYPQRMSNANGTPNQARIDLLYSFCRMQLPAISLPLDACEEHLHRTFDLYQSKNKEEPVTWDFYLDNLYPLDWFVTAACLEGNEAAWENLFAARAYRSDCLLMDALRSRAAWLYPRDEERQESSVLEFWSNLFIPPDTPQGLPVLKRYDGLRPLVPWLIRVFQNHHLSKLRNKKGEQALPEDDIIPLPAPQPDRWHDVFCDAAREWLLSIGEKELLILGLRLRYNMSQRDVAGILEIHEGTISRRTDALSEQWKETISKKMIEQGWTGDSLADYVRTEMRNLLLDDPRLSIDNLAKILAAQGKTLPNMERESKG